MTKLLQTQQLIEEDDQHIHFCLFDYVIFKGHKDVTHTCTWLTASKSKIIRQVCLITKTDILFVA